jgi:hypothetical protein
MYREMRIAVKTMFQEILCALDTEVMLRSVMGVLHNFV